MLKTSFDYPPIPDRRFDWSAYNPDTIDYDWDGERYVTSAIIGRGPTEADAIADYQEQMRERLDSEAEVSRGN